MSQQGISSNEFINGQKHKILDMLNRFFCQMIIYKINWIFRRNNKRNLDTILFFLTNPLYIQIYESVLKIMLKSSKFNIKVIINGKRKSFCLNKGLEKHLSRQYPIIYFPSEKVFGMSCSYIIANSPQYINGVKYGQTIHLPYLTTEAMHYFGLLFEDKMYSDGFPLQNKINHVIHTYNTQGSMCNLYNTIGCNISKASFSSSKLRIAFFSQLPALWQSAESVWQAMHADDRCEVSVIQLPFYHENYRSSEDIGLFLKKKNIPFYYWYNYDLSLSPPDVIIFLSPYDSTRPNGYRFNDIHEKFSKTVYIYYALEVSGGYIIDYNFRQSIHLHSWKIFVRSQRYKELFKKYCPENYQNVIVTGHPKMDLVYNLDSHTVPYRLVHKIKKRKVILWNPHHTLQKDEWSTFEEWNDILLDVFKKRTDLFLLIRPHPLLFKNIESLPDGKNILTSFLKKIRKMNNVFIDRSDSYLDAFKVSDGLISDASSLLLEYLPTKKPILYTPKVGGGGLNDDGNELIQYLYQGLSKNQISNFIDMVAQGKDPMYQLRTSQIEKFLYTMDGNAGYRIKEEIINSFKG